MGKGKKDKKDKNEEDEEEEDDDDDDEEKQDEEEKNMNEEASVPPPSQFVLDEMVKNTQNILKQNISLLHGIQINQQQRFNMNHNQYPMLSVPMIPPNHMYYQQGYNMNINQYQSAPNYQQSYNVNISQYPMQHQSASNISASNQYISSYVPQKNIKSDLQSLPIINSSRNKNKKCIKKKSKIKNMALQQNISSQQNAQNVTKSDFKSDAMNNSVTKN